MLDTTSAQFRQSLAETIVWCETQRIVAEVEESAEIRHRRTRIEEASRLMQKAHERVKGKWWAEVFEQRDYRRARKLLDEANPGLIVPLEAQLRSKALKPERSLSEAQEDAREALVGKVVHERSVRLGALREIPSVPEDVELGKGKLLLYVPEENLADGAATYPSKGFFDVDNTPPWDTWVHYTDKTLVSWVPPVLVPLVSDGIDANPEGCIRWAG